MMELNRQRLNVHSSNILKNKMGLDELNQIAMLQHGLKWAEREKGESGQSRQIQTELININWSKIGAKLHYSI